MELFVRMRNGRSRSRSLARKASAPGIACSSCTSTPSMSISQERVSRTKGSLRGLAQLAAALGSGDQLVAHLLLRHEARLHAEVHGLRMVGHDGDRRLLGLDGVAARQGE